MGDSNADPADQSDMEIVIEIPSRVDFVALVRMIVAAAANCVDGLKGDRLDDLRWVTSEATTNAIEANLEASELAADLDENEELLTVEVRCDVSAGRVLIEVTDRGRGLSDIQEVPDMAHPDRLAIEGGFGLPLIEQLSTSMSFKPSDSGSTIEIELRQDR